MQTLPTTKGNKMATQIESKLAYVKRKLNDPAYNNMQLSRATGLTPAAISRIANGDTKNPTYETVEKIASYFQGLK
jgi:transcriptional regulator with XRE-family HTH domain